MPLEVPSGSAPDTTPGATHTPTSPVAAAAMAVDLSTARAAVQHATESPATAFDDIRELLVSLLPEAGSTVSVEDIGGHRYEFRPNLAIRREFQLKEWFRGLSGGDQDSFKALAGMGGQKVAARLLAFPESLIDELDRAFLICHGGRGELLERARLQASGDAPETPSDALRPSDLFRTTELLRAVVPFCVAPLIELLELIRPIASRLGSL